ncbi:MAG: hypothetical protein K8R60_06545 [Burkholderiales bacterium]|nr:hypothetical protein [Burkholderiales bacterium]
MKVRALAIVAVALAGAVSAGLAEARDRDNVQFSVTVGQPVYGGWVQPAPAYGGWVQPAPVYRGYHQPTRFDRDGDGIPNRYDRLYNPAWDRDGDGIPNRYDRFDGARHDRDRDGIPDRFDRNDVSRGGR